MRRALPWLTRRFTVYALVRSPQSAAALRAAGVIPVTGDLDRPHSLHRLAGLATHVLHSAPPPAAGADDPRTRRLLAALSRGGSLPRGVVYISTSGVYGDCQGSWVAETRPLGAESDRARRRVAAEQHLRHLGRRHARVAILRAPGIYAADRLPVDRVRTGTPALADADDGYSNHIHADDLARASGLALFRGRSNRIYNVNDDCQWKMGEWFDRVADTYDLPRPARLPREAMQQAVSPALWSFMRESRRLDNTRLKREMRVRLQHPTPEGLLTEIARQLRKS